MGTLGLEHPAAHVRYRIANGQLNDGTSVTAELGDDTIGPVFTTPTGNPLNNFIGIFSDGFVSNIHGYDVLNNTAQALATGNDADNRIGGNLDGDDHSIVIASLQVNQNGTTVTATATAMGIGVLVDSDGDGLVRSQAQVNGNLIGSQAIGNNVVNVIGGPGIGGLGI